MDDAQIVIRYASLINVIQRLNDASDAAPLASAGAVAEFVAGFMNYKMLVAAVALIAVPFALPSASAAKAYEVAGRKHRSVHSYEN